MGGFRGPSSWIDGYVFGGEGEFVVSDDVGVSVTELAFVVSTPAADGTGV